MEIGFCLQCGTALEDREIGGRVRRACPACDYVHWGNYSIGVGAAVLKEGKVLLIRRAQEPGRGVWTVPGGYIEEDETIEVSAVREVLEETGIEAKVLDIIALRDAPRTVHNLYVVFQMAYVSGTPVADGTEVDRAGFYSLEEMEGLQVAGLSRWIAETALERERPGLTLDAESPYEFHGKAFRLINSIKH